jgi:hypothetical protein
MFVQSKTTTTHAHKNGLAIEQRRGTKETLVQWENGSQRWESTSDLQGEVVLIGHSNDYDLSNAPLDELIYLFHMNYISGGTR